MEFIRFLSFRHWILVPFCDPFLFHSLRLLFSFVHSDFFSHRTEDDIHSFIHKCMPMTVLEPIACPSVQFHIFPSQRLTVIRFNDVSQHEYLATPH